MMVVEGEAEGCSSFEQTLAPALSQNVVRTVDH